MSSSPQRALPLPFFELILLLAAMFSIMAFSIDSTLPAMPDIARELVPENATRAQLVIGSFVFGTGLGQLLFGPVSDSFGRRTALTLGVALYVLAAFGARQAGSLDALLVFRFIQGLGASAPRIVSQAITRDLFKGREQARVSSLTFMFFVVVPAVAPLAGQQVIEAFGWRSIFTLYMAMGGLLVGWFLIRMPETLRPENVRPFRLSPILRAGGEVLRTPVALRYLVVMGLAFGQLIGYISSAQHVYVEALGAGERFPLYFALVALISAGSAFLNSRLVMRLGMRKLIIWAFATQVVFAGLLASIWGLGWLDGLSQTARLWIFILWSITLFFMNGLTFGNAVALSMEPLGHIAGTASAVLGAASTMIGVALAVPIGLAFDGTPRPVMTGAALCSALALWLVWRDRGRARDQG